MATTSATTTTKKKKDNNNVVMYVEEYCRDHFSLSIPSSTIRFRPTTTSQTTTTKVKDRMDEDEYVSTTTTTQTQTAARIFETQTAQWVLEETLTTTRCQSQCQSQSQEEEQQEEQITRRDIQMKQMWHATKGLQFLRLTYTIVCLFWMGILLVFCLQCMLIMLLEAMIAIGQVIPVQEGENVVIETNSMGVVLKADRWGLFIGVVLGLFVLVYAFASALVLSWAFVSDTWSGHSLMQQFFFGVVSPDKKKQKHHHHHHHHNHHHHHISSTRRSGIVDWIFFCFFLFFPLLVLCICLLAKVQQSWAVTAIVWFASVAIFFVLFAANVVYYEVTGTVKLVQRRRQQQHHHHHHQQQQALVSSLIVNPHPEDEEDQLSPQDYEQQLQKSNSLWEAMKECILMTQRQKYSGIKSTRYVGRSLISTATTTTATTTALQQQQQQQQQQPEMMDSTLGHQVFLYSRMTQWRCLSCLFYQSSEEGEGQSTNTHPDDGAPSLPHPIHSIDDVQENHPFLTRYTWSLEQFYCRNPNSKQFAIIEGPGALTGFQIKSSLACNLIGIFLHYFILTSFLVWMEVTWSMILFTVILVTLLSLKHIKSFIRLINVGRKVLALREGPDDDNDNDNDGGRAGYESVEEDVDQHHDDDDNNQEDHVVADEEEVPEGFASTAPRTYMTKSSSLKENKAVFVVLQRQRITQPKDFFCWIMLFVELCLFVLYPTIALFMLDVWNVGILFLVIAIVTAIRQFINLIAVLHETGSLHHSNQQQNHNPLDLMGSTSYKDKSSANTNATVSVRAEWKDESRLSSIINFVTYDHSRKVWLYIFLLVAVFLVFLVVGAFGTQTDPTQDENLSYLNTSVFYYPPSPNDIRYPSCHLNKDLFGENATLVDYTFMAALPYKKEEIVLNDLQVWFGGEVVDEMGYVDAWRADQEDPTIGKSKVFFRLLRFVNTNRGVVSIRGTQNRMELLADAQLWSTTIFLQVLRAFLPLGDMWTPILDEVAFLINGYQSGALKQVSFYRTTTAFVNNVTQDPNYAGGVAVTGHSLGGGLAIITGAQAHVPAVAISGPNAMISGRSFDPPVTPDELNQYTLNVIPDRDIVPMVDDPADQVQRIRCTGPRNSPMDCHAKTRALCEIMYKCGSGVRPVFCECVTLFGYPKPSTYDSALSGLFDEVCPPQTD